MNAELDFQLMKSHVSELHQAAAEHRRVREAKKANKSERRSVFARLRSA